MGLNTGNEEALMAEIERLRAEVEAEGRTVFGRFKDLFCSVFADGEHMSAGDVKDLLRDFQAREWPEKGGD